MYQEKSAKLQILHFWRCLRTWSFALYWPYIPQNWVKIKQVGEFKQIQKILSKIGTEFFKIDEEMTEKNESEDGNSISLKSPWHMKWDR